MPQYPGSQGDAPAPPGSTLQSRHEFLRRHGTLVAIVAALAAAGVLLYYATPVLLVLFASVLWAIALNRMTMWVAVVSGLPRRAALGLVVLTVLALVIGFSAWLVPEILTQVNTLIEELGQAMDDLLQRAEGQPLLQDMIRSAVAGVEEMGGSGEAIRAVFGYFATTLEVAIAVLAILVIGLYLVVDPPLYLNGMLHLVPLRRRTRIRQILGEVENTLWWWLLAQLVSMTVIGVSCTVALWLLGIPLPVTLGLFAGLVAFIPNIGAVLGLLPPLVLALQKDPVLAVYVVVFYLSLQFLETWIITPMVQQYGARIPPVIVLSSQLLMAVLAGVIGVTFATPLAAAVIVLTRNVYVEDFLGDYTSEHFNPPDGVPEEPFGGSH